MERKVIDCDKCNREAKSPIRLKIPNGTHDEFDGHRSETYQEYTTKDLCHECLQKMFDHIFSLTPRRNPTNSLIMKYLGIKEKS